jgi:hypothetical protein
MNKLINDLKDSGQDFEFYPTKGAIVADLHKELNKTILLDIGAGNGILFKQLRELDEEYEYSVKEAFAIEKSQILIDQMEPDVFVLGTDFHQQTLIDKKVDAIFCNPPYTEYEDWSTRIIREANCPTVYLVIPDRWEGSTKIKKAIEQREAKVEVLGSYTFEDSEFRKARARVQLLKVKLSFGGWNSNTKVDPFSLWYDENFKPEVDKGMKTKKTTNNKESLHALVKGTNLIESLSELYNEELKTIQDLFNSINQIDATLLKELGVNQNDVCASLQMKYKGLKSLYWNELFNNLKKITDRLTKKTRDQMVAKLTGNTSVDFTPENAYATVIWSIKNANEYINEQLVEVFKWLSTPDYVKTYKSNERFLKETWKFHASADDNPYTHYTLDYRIVTSCDLMTDSYYDKSGTDRLNDIMVVAGNLGFDIVEDVFELDFKRGKNMDIHYKKDGKEELFCSCRFYANGNGHFKFNQEFMLKMNVEVGRILKWVNTPKEASEEMGIPEDMMKELFGSNTQLGFDNTKLIGN